MSTAGLLERWFGLRAHGTTVRTEVLGGVTTFATMAYIIVANPAILQHAGFHLGATTVATIVVAVFGCLLMGLYANRPLAVAPYMGENAFIAFALVAAGTINWQMALGAVFISGLAFLVLTLIGLRGWLANSISASMRHSFAVGIGLFLAFIGLFESGIVRAGKAVPVEIGNFRDPAVLVALFGFLTTAVLMAWRVKGALLLGMVAGAVAAYPAGVGRVPEGVAAVPFVGDYSLAPIAGQLDVAGILRVNYLPALLTLFLMSFLDTLGTLTGVGAAGGMLDADGNFPDVERPMLVDATTCVFSALIGTSTSGAFIESAAGVREGARTGLAAVVTGLLFAAALFFIPLVQPLQQMKHVYAPALIAVGVLMMASVTKIDFEDLTEAIPAFVTIVMMVFTYNIGNGLTAGLIVYPVLKALAGRWREVNGGALVLGGACLVYYVFGLPH